MISPTTLPRFYNEFMTAFTRQDHKTHADVKK